MVVVSIIAALILIASLFNGFKEGAVKQGFGLLFTIIAIPLTGLSYGWLAGIISFLPDGNWENFLGFFVTMVVIVLLLQLATYFPRLFMGKLWKKGFLYRLLGGTCGIINGAINLALFALVLHAFPIFDWLDRWVYGSGLVQWAVSSFDFVRDMLPELFRTGFLTLLG